VGVLTDSGSGGGTMLALLDEARAVGVRRPDELMSLLSRVIDRLLAGDPRAQRPLRELRALLAERDGPDDRAVCVRHGRRWRVETAGQVAMVGHSVGMLHLATLIANPGVEIAAVDVAAGADALARAANRGTGTGQPVLDHTATLTYRRRLVQLHEQIDELTADGKHEAAVVMHTEREWILRELRAGTTSSGRPRAFSDNRERARIAVGRAIRRAIAHIEDANPLVGAHLRDSVHTGVHCWYRPAPVSSGLAATVP
jgi:hypothetical protein